MCVFDYAMLIVIVHRNNFKGGNEKYIFCDASLVLYISKHVHYIKHI